MFPLCAIPEDPNIRSPPPSSQSEAIQYDIRTAILKASEIQYKTFARGEGSRLFSQSVILGEH